MCPSKFESVSRTVDCDTDYALLSDIDVYLRFLFINMCLIQLQIVLHFPFDRKLVNYTSLYFQHELPAQHRESWLK